MKRRRSVWDSMVQSAWRGMAIDLAFALVQAALVLRTRSVWFVATAFYYGILGVARLWAVLAARGHGKGEKSAQSPVGALLIALSLALGGIVWLSAEESIAPRHDKILMITIAAYTFFKAGLVVWRAVKQRRDPSPLLRVIRRLGAADAAASLLSLQRSLLVSFPGMEEAAARRMNLLAGAAGCLFILALGAGLLVRARKRA